MKKEIDCRGQACPRPVIMTKKELDSIEEGTITIIVDNEVAKENVSKFAKSSNFDFTVNKGQAEEEYYITIVKGQGEETEVSQVENSLKDTTIAITSNTMGGGAEELGHILMKSFIYTVSETQPLPRTMVFYNSGAYLTCKNSQVLDDLKNLESLGVELITCGTCLDYYDIKDDLAVGSISNMYTIYEKISNAKNNITIG